MSDGNVRVKGPHLLELESVLAQTIDFQTSIVVSFDPAKPIPINAARETEVIVALDVPRQNKPKTLLELRTPFGQCIYTGDVCDGMLDLAEICSAGIPFNERGSLLAKSIVVKAKNAPIPSKELKKLALEAWFEAFGLVPPNAKQMKAMDDEKNADLVRKREQHLNALKSGAKNWKRIPLRELRKCNYQQSDLAGARLTKVALEQVDFRNSNFDNANFSNGSFYSADIRGATFRGANLINVKITTGTKINGCDFSAAKLEMAQIQGDCSGCKFDSANLKNAYFEHPTHLADATFVNTDLSAAELFHCDLKGVNFSQAVLENVLFINCTYNAETRWPVEFAKPQGLQFKGPGEDPFLTAKWNAEGSIDCDTLISRLSRSFDQDRLKKSLQMLKSEKFQLFSEVNESSVVGIVKSQTDPNLVYSCRLAHGGDYSCCTQNLNACGGLRGALCKHLLVLLIGLSKSKELDATKTYRWMIQSLDKRPELNKEIASDVFLRYKSAQAGDLDWRPTETIPEDYYAY